MSQKRMFPREINLGLDPDAVIDPRDESDLLPLYLQWKQEGFEAIDDGDALRLCQWVRSHDCPLRDAYKEEYLHAYDWEMLNRERMEGINQFFYLRDRIWGIRLAIRGNHEIKVVHLGQGEFNKNVGSKPTKLLRPNDGASIWTKVLIPQAAYRGCLYGCLDSVRKKGGLAYLLSYEEQLQMKLK